MIAGIGIDLAEVARFVFDERRRLWYARRIFTAGEITYASEKRRPEQHLAACFAAKEAARKAFGCSLPWQDVEVGHASSGAPRLVFRGTAKRYEDERKITRVHVTLTHTATHAAAMVILESEGADARP